MSLKNTLAEIMFRRAKAYKRVFRQSDDVAHASIEDIEIVLSDLFKQAGGKGSLFMGDSEKTLVMVGKHMMWQRIQSYLNIPESKLAEMLAQNEVKQENVDD